MAVPQGSGYVCLDASPLIGYADIGELSWLTTWFGGCGFTAEVVTAVELTKSLRSHPQNADILALPWLRSQSVEEEEDLKLVAQLRGIWGSPRGRDHGEAEIIALCRRYGWTAILDDRQGRNGAIKHGVRHVHSTSVLVAAMASRMIGADEAWDLHRRLVADDDPPILPPDDRFQDAFNRVAIAFRRVLERDDEPPWPRLLSVPGLDEIIGRAVARAR